MEVIMEFLAAILMAFCLLFFVLLGFRISIPFIFKKGKEGDDAEKS